MLIRLGVYYIVTDMNVAYYSLIKECFPNTKRFHIIQHLNRAFDGVRKQIMKQLNPKDPSQAKYYRQLKSLHRLFLKPEERLDFTTFKK